MANEYDIGLSNASAKDAIQAANKQLNNTALVADKVLTSVGGKVTPSSRTTAELDALSGITGNIESRITNIEGGFGGAYMDFAAPGGKATDVYVSSTPIYIKYGRTISSSIVIVTNSQEFKATVLKTGCYMITYFASFSSTVNLTSVTGNVIVNGSTATHIGSVCQIDINEYRSVSVSSPLNLNAGDYVQLMLTANVSATLQHNAGGFNVEYIGPKGTVV